MATYHCEMKTGRNASEHADYVARRGFHGKRGDLIASGHGNLPSWTGGDPNVLWKAAEKYERKNGAVYHEVVIALPGELDFEQNMALVEDLVSKLAPGRPHQFAVHAPNSSLEGEPNPHVHLMKSNRMDDGIDRPAEQFFSRYNPSQPEKGGRKKASGGRNRMELRDDVIATRKVVAETINHHLAINGHDTRVDHRTLRDQGVERDAECHLGQARIRGMSARDRDEYIGMRGRNRGSLSS
ncbi:MobA/MobL family protein [Rhodanobacter caeni]|uniref:MobA/MobL protein domain-containing protein n=1 Tax=Rhodanobacter caeni TaxID=657654 RepID=A0ABP3E5N2_9GAMM